MNSSNSQLLIKVVRESLDLKPSTMVTLDSSLTDELGADSVDIVVMAMAVEEEFGINLSDDQMGEAKTYGDLLALVDQGVQQRNNSGRKKRS